MKNNIKKEKGTILQDAPFFKPLITNNKCILNINDISIKSIVKFAIHKDDGDIFITTKGRQAQALYCLIKAGNKGITALEVSSWALRLAVYVHSLRHRFELNIKTKDEPQLNGLQPYARYILQDDISIIGIR